MKRVIDVILVTAAILTLVAAVGVNYHHRKLVSARISEGSELALKGMDWRKTENTVVLGLSLDCTFCNQSTDFYRRLSIDAVASNNRVVAVFPQPRTETEKWLAMNGIVVSIVRQERLPSLGMWMTPTLAVVDDEGIVRRLFIGKLSGEEENQLLSNLKYRAGGNRSGGEDSYQHISETDFAKISVTTRHVILDVRNRQSFSKGHRPGAVNIPHDELGVRARIEIPHDRLVVMDCLLLSSGCLPVFGWRSPPGRFQICFYAGPSIALPRARVLLFPPFPFRGNSPQSRRPVSSVRRSLRLPAARPDTGSAPSVLNSGSCRS